MFFKGKKDGVKKLENKFNIQLNQLRKEVYEKKLEKYEVDKQIQYFTNTLKIKEKIENENNSEEQNEENQKLIEKYDELKEKEETLDKELNNLKIEIKKYSKDMGKLKT